MRIGLIWLLCLLQVGSVCAQRFESIHTRWDDSFMEWDIKTDLAETDGQLTKRWPGLDDWSAWKYTLGDEHGDISLAYKNDPTLWELSGPNDRVTARAMWRNDFSQWRITNDSRSLRLQTRQRGIPSEWIVDSPDYGYFKIYMDWEGDPRDWFIIDELSEEITPEMKMMLIFIAIYHSSPKR